MEDAISPLDGRYYPKIKELSRYFSESALMRYRLKVEIEYLISILDLSRSLSRAETARLQSIYLKFKSPGEVKGFEKKTNHDVKAIEYYIKANLGKEFNEYVELIHFALTSEDVNNISYALMLKDGIRDCILPAVECLMDQLRLMARRYRTITMLSRTHGQPASPTTLGKEFSIYYSRLKRQSDLLAKQQYLGKLNGASGNYNAHVAAYPGVDWISFSRKFVRSLGLEPNLITYQIEPHDWNAEIYHNLSRINTIIINLDQDIWAYISQDYLSQKAVKGEVGSSAMPHKVNPIDFENSEGNLGLANSILAHMAGKLPITRMQRDLSDSTVIRNQGTALGYMLLGLKSTDTGLSKIDVNRKSIAVDLDAHPEVLAEAIQTILRREKQELPYEKLMSLTRGKRVTLMDLHRFIDGLDVSSKLKKEMKAITPSLYIGMADELVGLAVKK